MYIDSNGDRWYKGNLHTHTTRSDGRTTPEETIRQHAENGYDFLAITDHRNYNFANPVPGSRLTIIPGMEFDAHIAPRRRIHCFHTVWIGPEKPENPYDQDQVFEREDVKDQFDFQEKYLNDAHKNKQLTIYCHPQWSGTTYRDFGVLKGNMAMELWNSGCAIEDGVDTNALYWDDMLDKGHRIWGVATDDGHQMYQHCKGWVMVNSENNVSAILDALKAVGIPAVEVHISDVDAREPFRQISYAGMACIHTIKGQGLDGYRQAILYLKAYLNN